MNGKWRNLLGIFRKDGLYSQVIAECHDATDKLSLLLNVYLARLGRLPPPPPATDVSAAEKALWDFDSDARKKIQTHIASSGPGHLIAGLVILTTVIDLEKLIDNVRQFRGITTSHPYPLRFEDLEVDVAETEKQTLALFQDMRKAIKGEDMAFSRDVIARYKGGLSKACDEIAGRLLGGDVADISAADAAAASIYVTNLKKIGVHSRNLITSVASPYQRVGTNVPKIR